MADEGLKAGKKCSSGRVFLGVLFVAMLACIIALAVVVGLGKVRDEPKPTPKPTSEPPREDDDQEPRSATGHYRFAAVAADAEICSKIGTDILGRRGGSAVDAAIASLLCLGVVHTHSTGIGGGFFMTIYDSVADEVVTLIGREVAPQNASSNMFVNTGASSTKGGMAIAVPGEMAGMAAAHARYGKLPWAALFEPTIDLCERGIKVTDALDTAIQTRIEDIRESETMRETFLKPDGTPLKAGDVMTRSVLAQTLRKIANEGAEVFYNGTLAADIVDDIQDNGGILTLEDLSSYRALWKEPVSVTLDNGGYTLYGPPPPSSGAIIQYILNILDGYNFTSSDVTPKDKLVLTEHRLIEALKFGFAKRSHLGDEDYVDVQEWKDRLQDKGYAEETRAKISDFSVLNFTDYEPGFELVEDAGTTHLSVYGPDGSVVGVTASINTYFGSKVKGARTGIIFNNEMDDFSTPNTSNSFGLPASPSNFIVPGKRPMSSMSPTLVKDGAGVVRLVAGASGGTRIISGTLEVIMNSLWLGYNLTEAVDRFRVHHQLLPDYVRYEAEMPQEILTGLEKKGHTFNLNIGIFCVVQAIQNICQRNTTAFHPYDDLCIVATSDIRKNGAPDGY